MSAIARPQMSKQITSALSYKEAKAITKEIANAVENVHTLLLRAYEGKAWSALGYPNWREYATQEFQYSQRRAYQLLDYAKVMDVMEDCTIVQKPNEAQARPLAKLESPKDQQEAWKEAVKESGGKPTAKHVEAAVAKRAPRPIKAAEFTPEQQAKIDEASQESEQLWLAKQAFKKLSKKERAAFINWAAQL